MHTSELLSTFTTAAALGVALFALANYLRISAIVVLLIGGVLAGPQVLGIVNPDALGDGLSVIISLAVAIILFEGGLTLDLKGYRSASKEILGILTIGVVVTWVGATFLLRLLFDFDIPFCFLAASLIIVTGPTVIGPLLHRIRVKQKLHHILHWEGVLIDPIGVFIALLSFEYYVSTDITDGLIVKDFLLRFVTGITMGVAFGFFLDFVLRREVINKGHTNIFVLAMAMLNFGLADLVIGESGLLSVTVAGLVLGSRKTKQLRDIVIYKVELKDFLIGLLFVLLAANLNLYSFLDYGWKLIVVVLGVMLLLRPLNVFASTWKSTLTSNEKLFLCWIAPRGIVAASMASIFALELTHLKVENAMFLETFTYSVIAGTVLIQGVTAGVVGRALGVVHPVSTGWIIVGAHAVGRQVANFLIQNKVDVVLIDTNALEVREAKRAGLNALSEDAMLMNPDASTELYGCEHLLALTTNPDLNRMLCRRWSELIDGDLLRWEQQGYETEQNEHLLSGTRVWESFSLNSWMHPESDAPPITTLESGGALPESENIMALGFDGKVSIGSNDNQTDVQKWLLFDSASSVKDRLPLTPNNVVFSESESLMDLYREMLEHLHRQIPAIDPKAVFEGMWKREEEYTSLLGHGIALPHVWTDKVDSATLMIACPRGDLRCPLTDADIKIVFMLISPAGKPDDHLRHLSHIAKIVGTESKREKLLQAFTPKELYQAIESS